jgi:hypothetical protein
MLTRLKSATSKANDNVFIAGTTAVTSYAGVVATYQAITVKNVK